MKRLWIPWAVVVAVAVVTAIVPGLRDETRLMWATLPSLRDAAAGKSARGTDPIMRWFVSFRKGPMQAAARRHARDPELMGAAGSLLLPRQDGLSALRQVAQTSQSPIVWSAYVDVLLDSGIRYERAGTAGIDPARPRQVAEAKRMLAAQRIPTALTLQQAQPLLDALHAWQRADPENGLPLALEAWCLYGRHQDAQALARWQEAARRPRMESYHRPRLDAVRRVLVEAGYPEPEAAVIVNLYHFPALEKLQSMGRAALYEGRLAQLAGRSREAVSVWQATQSVGSHLEASAETTVPFLVGTDIEGIGGTPAWVWLDSSQTGEQGGGPNGGHLYYGPAHEFYVSQVGAAADAHLRDDLVRARMRLNILRQFGDMRDQPQWYPRAGDVLAFAQMLLVFLLGLMAVAVVARLTGRGDRPALRSPWHLLTALPALAVLAPVAGLTTALAVRADATVSRFPVPSQFWESVALGLLAGVICPLLVALSIRASGLSRLGAWRANLRTGLPVAAAIGAVVFLGCSLAALQLRTAWVKQATHPKHTEMQMAAHFGGKQWENPRTPPDVWRAQTPEEAQTAQAAAGPARRGPGARGTRAGFSRRPPASAPSPPGATAGPPPPGRRPPRRGGP